MAGFRTDSGDFLSFPLLPPIPASFSPFEDGCRPGMRLEGGRAGRLQRILRPPDPRSKEQEKKRPSHADYWEIL
jgi:hypothetical protein